MHRTVLISLALWCIAIQPVAAQIPDEIRNHFNEHIVGSWINETTWGKEKITGHSMNAWDEIAMTVRSVGYAADSKGQLLISETHGWDPFNKEWVSHGFDSRGSSWTVRWKQDQRNDSTRWVGTGAGVYDGKKWESATKLIFNKNEARYEDTTDGLPFVTISKRKDKVGNGTMPDTIRQMIDRNYVGSWSFKSNYDGGLGEGTYVEQWSRSGDCLVGYQKFSTPAGAFQATLLTGWDALNSSLLMNFYCTNGDYLQIRYTNFGEAAWKGRISGTYGGERIEGPAEIRWEANGFDYESSSNGKTYKASFTRLP